MLHIHRGLGSRHPIKFDQNVSRHSRPRSDSGHDVTEVECWLSTSSASYIHLSTLRTSSQVLLDDLRLRPNIKIKNINRQPKRRTSIRNIDDTSNMPLYRRTGQKQIDLIIIVAVSAEVSDDCEHISMDRCLALACSTRSTHLSNKSAYKQQ